MSCPFLHNQNIVATTIKPKLRPDPTIGTRITFYDQTFVWTDEHLSPSQLNEWRKRGDPLIDVFFQHFGEQLQDGDDTYEMIQRSSVVDFDYYLRERPAWFDREQIQRGQHFFLRNSSMALTSIFYYTLLLGYGFQQLNEVLLKTQYLSSEDLSLTHRRFVETLQMIATAVCGDVDNFDQTFSDVLRVRLLHGMVRYKIMKHRLSSNDNDDVPINQEDSLITLLGFSFSVLYCIEERLNIVISDEDKNAYLHLWRYIGWLIGIEDEYLHYLSSYRLAKIISESIFYHYYLPSQVSKHMVHHSLMATYHNSKLGFSLKFAIGISQILLGPELSQALDMDQPPMDTLHRYMVRLFLKSFRFSNWLGSLNYPRLRQWILEHNRRRLSFLVYTGLNYELKNFALFKSYRSSAKQEKSISLKDCPCQYYQKKQHGMIKTHDVGFIRMKKPFSFTPFFQQSLLILAIFTIIRCWSGVIS